MTLLEHPMRNGIPNLGALQAFEATARLGSFSRAAEELSLTHSAVYRQVSGLEQRLGVQLFTRVRRRVALKVIKPGMDSAQVIARFEAERQALAMMDHPNIAKVCIDGVAFATTTREGNSAIMRVEAWDRSCPGGSQG